MNIVDKMRNKIIIITILAFLFCSFALLSFAESEAERYVNEGRNYGKSGQYEAAMQSFQKAIEINPKYAGAYHGIGDVYVALSRFKEAISAFKRAIELNPNYDRAYLNLGACYAALSMNNEAILPYQKAIQLNPEYTKAYYNLGVVYNNLSRHDEAISVYKKAIDLDPNFVEAYQNLGVSYGSLGLYQEEISICQKAINLSPRNVALYVCLAAAYGNLGDYDKVIVICQKAIEIDSICAMAYSNLGSAYLRLNQKEKAKTNFKKAIQLFHQQGKQKEAEKIEGVLLTISDSKTETPINRVWFYLIFVLLIISIGNLLANIVSQPIYIGLNKIWSLLLLGREKSKRYYEWENNVFTSTGHYESFKAEGQKIIGSKTDIFFFGKNVINVCQGIITALVFAILTVFYNKIVHLDVYILAFIVAVISWINGRRYFMSTLKILIYIGSYCFFLNIFNKF